MLRAFAVRNEMRRQCEQQRTATEYATNDKWTDPFQRALFSHVPIGREYLVCFDRS
jgi:hypothetical protein